MKRHAAVLAIGALALAGCSSIEKDASYGTVESLGKAVSEVLDIDCGKGTGSSASSGWDQDTCGDKAVIGVFTSASKLKEVKTKNPTTSASKIVEGSNWIVWVKGGKEKEVQEKMGGRLVEAPKLFTGVINLDFTPPQGYIVKTGTSCYGSPTSPYKDLGYKSKATITTADGLELTGPLASSTVVSGVCTMRYEVPSVPADQGPYKLQIGNRQSPEATESDLKSGVKLYIGGTR